MRDILFRGRRLDNDEWVYGYYFCETHYLHLYKPQHNIFSGVNDYNEQYGTSDYHMAQVDPTTVGQFTGLTDKNGKKIFEGDIVTQPVRETRQHSPCVIEFYNGCFKAHYISDKRFFDRYYDINSFTKVIGNIHDNPELLGGAE